MTPILLTHYFTFFRSLGGVQSLLQRHLANDAVWGLDSNIAAFFDPITLREERVRGLGLSWRSSVRRARVAFRRELASFRKPFAVYHNFWGLPFLADLDAADRRIAVLHSYAPVLRDYLKAEDGLVDGVLCVSDALKEVVFGHLPSLDRSRVVLLPLPIARCPFPVQHAALRDRPLVLGIAGRLQKEQKRIDRVPELVARLEREGLNFRLELLGTGPCERPLKRTFAGNPRVALLGHQAGEAYWKGLANWDVIIFTSEYEGLPLALLEAMSIGVLPIYPRIRSGGDGYAASVDKEFLYEPAEFVQAVRALARIADASEEQRSAWRAGCRALVSPHLGDAYHDVFADFAREIARAPRVSMRQFPARRFHLTDFFPFGLLDRLCLEAFYRRNDR
jgi:glycosyltransferase involved in cell wall biosynthesis